MPANWCTGAGYMEQAWHGLMPVFTEKLSVSEAMEFGEMNFEYTTQPATSLYIDEATEERHEVVVPGRYDLWRKPYAKDPIPRLIRTIGNRYHVLQPAELASILDPLSTEWPTETVGVLDDWKIMFATLSMQPHAVGGFEKETTQTYLMASDDKGRPGAAHWGIITVRVVCQNTYLAALSSAKEINRIPHNVDVQGELAFRRDLALHALKTRELVLGQFDEMIKFQMTMQQFERMLEGAFPYEAKPRELELAALIPQGASGQGITDMVAKAQVKQEWLDKRNDFANKQRDESKRNLEDFNDNYSYAANTLWAGFNAITQQNNHSTLYRGNPVKQKVNVLWGDRNDSMNAAFKEAVDILNNKN